MDLIERLKKIAEEQKIPLDEVSLKRAEIFLKEHESHDSLEIRVGVNEGEIRYIHLGCGPPAIYYVEVYNRDMSNPKKT